MREAIFDFVRPFLTPADREPVLGDLAESYPRFSLGLVADAIRIVLRQLGRAWVESPLAMMFAIGAALAIMVIATRVGLPPMHGTWAFWPLAVVGAAIEGGLPVVVAGWLSPRRPAAAPFCMVAGITGLFVSSIDPGHVGWAFALLTAATYGGMYAGWLFVGFRYTMDGRRAHVRGGTGQER